MRIAPVTAALPAAAGTFCGKRCPNAPRGRSAGGALRACSGAKTCGDTVYYMLDI